MKEALWFPPRISLLNTPILPDRKPSGDYRFVQDLRLVNNAVHARAPLVPNNVTILSQVPPGSCCLSVINLANAFFSVPVAEESQDWISFTFLGTKWKWTVMLQGYVESP